MSRKSSYAALLAFAALLFLFFLGLDLMGLSFKLFGRGFADELVARTSNPFVGLVIGILATTLVQSSSTTTSMTVALVAGGALTVESAIPVIMGANIGTSVTNTIVSLGHVTRREEFRRAFAAATVHDFFNWLAVLLILPLELAFGFLSRFALMLEEVLEGTGGLKLLNPVKAVVRPVSEGISGMFGDSGVLTLIAGVVLLFASLRYLVVFLRRLMAGRAEQILHKTLFRSALAAIGAGVVMTVMVQSSSITTSLVVPLVGAGILTLEKVFPFTLGANIGTTVTAMLAALATGEPAAVTVAMAHLLFNLTGTVLIYPLRPIRAIPLTMARWMGDLGSRSRVAAASYIGLVFYGLPIALVLAFGGSGPAETRPVDAPPAVETPAPPAPGELGEPPADGAGAETQEAEAQEETSDV